MTADDAEQLAVRIARALNRYMPCACAAEAARDVAQAIVCEADEGGAQSSFEELLGDTLVHRVKHRWITGSETDARAWARAVRAELGDVLA